MWIIAIVVAAVVVLFLLVWWHALTFAYRCRSCDNEFEIAVLTDLVSPHGIGLKGDGWKLLHCPRCGRWTRARVLRKRPEGS